MEKVRQIQTENKIGGFGYVNKNCWLAGTINYPPSKRCQYCQLKFYECLFARYLAISLILISILLATSYLTDGKISKSLIVSLFVLIIVYGYFFSKSTEKIIASNFAERKSKEALQELTENLQQKVDEQTKEIQQAYEVEKRAKEELEVLDRSKNQFLMATQHHLRTPLSSIMGYDDLLLNGTYGKVPKKISDVIKKTQGLAQGLIRMVNEFLDITQFQLGKEVISLKDNVNLCPIFKDIIKDIELEANKKGIYLKIEKPEITCVVKADETKLKAALTNVFDNAVKYTKEGGIKIRLKVGNKKVRIEIEDTGIGIPKELLPRLFDITFERTEEAKKNFVTGRGIGLYLASQIIKAHNGRIWAESEGEGKGSTFYIELPAQQQT